jgi:peroxiredoxin
MMAGRGRMLVVRLGMGVAAAIVATLGLIAGMRLRDRVDPPLSQDAVLTAPPRLAPGRPFPDVLLVAEDGYSTTTHRLLGGHGGVVMFLEVGCPPCSLMVTRWDTHLEDLELAMIPVYGIGSEPIESLRRYKRELGFDFPVFSDSFAVLERDYEVTVRPLLLTIGKSRVVRSFTFDAREVPDPARLKRLLEP